MSIQRVMSIRTTTRTVMIISMTKNTIILTVGKMDIIMPTKRREIIMFMKDLIIMKAQMILFRQLKITTMISMIILKSIKMLMRK